jgi:putative intracellular protease/amidase
VAARTVGAVLFPGFELLDLFGPLEMLGMMPEAFHLSLVAGIGQHVASAQGPVSVADHQFGERDRYDVLLIPGGPGTRTEIDNVRLIGWLTEMADRCEIVASVCTGSALLARTGRLNGRRATTNKLAFDWVVSQAPQVHWQRRARWVEEGSFITSSGVTAGMDMVLALMARLHGQDSALQAARWAEYTWNADPAEDPFAV